MRRAAAIALLLLLLCGCSKISALPATEPPITAPPATEPAEDSVSPTAAPEAEGLSCYRERLQDTAAAYYDGILDAAESFSPYGVSGDGEALLELQRALIAVYYDYPETRMYIDLEKREGRAELKYFCAWEPERAFDADETRAMLEETESLAKKLISGMDAGMSDYDKYWYIAGAMAENVQYDHDHAAESSYIYGVLKNGLSICEGYADTYAYLCHMAGLWCIPVDGMANGVHAWNIVELDGETYHVDVTWGDTGREYSDRYFMLSEDDIAFDHARYSLYENAAEALAAGAKRDPSYNNAIKATGR